MKILFSNNKNIKCYRQCIQYNTKFIAYCIIAPSLVQFYNRLKIEMCLKNTKAWLLKNKKIKRYYALVLPRVVLGMFIIEISNKIQKIFSCNTHMSDTVLRRLLWINNLNGSLLNTLQNRTLNTEFHYQRHPVFINKPRIYNPV